MELKSIGFQGKLNTTKTLSILKGLKGALFLPPLHICSRRAYFYSGQGGKAHLYAPFGPFFSRPGPGRSPMPGAAWPFSPFAGSL
jgi:hypothetical protein